MTPTSNKEITAIPMRDFVLLDFLGCSVAGSLLNPVEDSTTAAGALHSIICTVILSRPPASLAKLISCSQRWLGVFSR